MKIAKMRIFCDICFFVALIVKVFSLGVTYYPILDDYIQYGGYPLYDSLSHVYLNIGTIATRPVAALLDPALWGKFYPDLWVALLIISVAFFVGVKLIASVLERTGIFVTPFLYAIVLLIPLGFEGTYWISASSRICVGLLFTGLAASLLTKMITENKNILFIPYAVLTLLSFSFYESVMVFSAFLQFVIIISFVKSTKGRITHLITPVMLDILILVYYKLAQNIGAMGSRASAFNLSAVIPNIKELVTQFFEIIVSGGIKTTLGGAEEGLYLAIYSPIPAIAIIAVSACCGYFGAKAPMTAKAKYCIPIGLGFTFLPLVPNLLTDTVWLTYRSIVPCLFGLTIISASILSFFLNNKKVRAVVIFLMVFIFMLGNLSELNTYKNVYEKDDALVSEIARQLDNDVLSGNKETIVVFSEGILKPVPQTSFYKDHVKSVCDSDWALTGAVRAKTRNIKIKMITPVLSLEGVDTEGKQIIYLGGNNG
jgi:hypothetical protein